MSSHKEAPNTPREMVVFALSDKPCAIPDYIKRLEQTLDLKNSASNSALTEQEDNLRGLIKNMKNMIIDLEDYLN